MILNIDDELMVDVEKISMVAPGDKLLLIDGGLITVEKDEQIEIIAKAFKWQHQTHIYNKDLKREGGK